MRVGASLAESRNQRMELSLMSEEVEGEDVGGEEEDVGGEGEDETVMGEGEALKCEGVVVRGRGAEEAVKMEGEAVRGEGVEREAVMGEGEAVRGEEVEGEAVMVGEDDPSAGADTLQEDCEEDHTPFLTPSLVEGSAVSRRERWRRLGLRAGLFLASCLVLLLGGVASPYHPNAAALYGFNDSNCSNVVADGNKWNVNNASIGWN